MTAVNKKLKIISILILILTLLRIFIDAYHSYTIALTDETLIDAATKATILNSYKRAFLQYGCNLLYSIIGILVAQNKLHKKAAIVAGILTLILCIILQFFEFAIVSFMISALPVFLYLYFAWKSES